MDITENKGGVFVVLVAIAIGILKAIGLTKKEKNHGSKMVGRGQTSPEEEAAREYLEAREEIQRRKKERESTKESGKDSNKTKGKKSKN